MSLPQRSAIAPVGCSGCRLLLTRTKRSRQAGVLNLLGVLYFGNNICVLVLTIHWIGIEQMFCARLTVPVALASTK